MAFTWTDIINGEIASSIRSKLNLLGTEAETLDTSVAQNTTNINTNTNDISTLQSDMSTAQSNINTNTSDILTNTDSIGNLPLLVTTDKSDLVGAINEVADAIIINNTTIIASQSVSDTTYTDYPYRIDLSIPKCTSDYIPTVYPKRVFTDVGFCPIVTSATNSISVWASNNSFANLDITVQLTKEV